MRISDWSSDVCSADLIVAEVEEAEAAAAGDHAEPRGSFTVTAPMMFGRIHVAPVLLDFLDAHPGVSARLALLDRVVDLMDAGFDVALSSEERRVGKDGGSTCSSRW